MFITFEGIEGTGKTTQITLLKKYLEEQGKEVLLTREPGGSRIGLELRKMLLHVENQDLMPLTELFLYLGDRAQHMGEIIRPALEQGKVVICDRFADSTIVYQGYGRGLDPKKLHQLNEIAVEGTWPDLTLLLDLDVETGLKRAMTRNIREGKTQKEGRFEAEHVSFHSRIREGYLTWAAINRERFKVADASDTPEAVFEQIKRFVEDRISA